MEGLTEWSLEYDTKKAAFYAIRAKGLPLTEEQHQKFMSDFAALRNALKKLNTQLGAGTIPASDLARREVLISNLEDAARRAYVPKATNLGNGTSGNSFGSSGSREQSMIDGGVFNPMELSGHGLMLHNKATIKLQDEIILEIGSGVDRLHHQALTIGDEAKLHNTLLSALDDNVDAGAEALRTEAKHAEDVRQKSRMCHLYICLVVEILALVILSIVYMNHG